MTRRVSIDQQIEEVRRELHLRDGVYPRLVQKGEMRQSVADYHMDRLRAALATLEWVKVNGERLRELVNRPRGPGADPGATP